VEQFTKLYNRAQVELTQAQLQAVANENLWRIANVRNTAGVVQANMPDVGLR
jgi:hypothetical protein